MVISEVEEIADEIESMEIRGAGKIARAAARGIKLVAEKGDAESLDKLVKELREAREVLQNTRPSAVSLANSLRFVTSNLNELAEDENLSGFRDKIIARAEEFINNSKEATKKIGKIGSRRISDGDTILTHCNSSNALSVIKTAHKDGKDIRVFATEARPRYQGHITVQELSDNDIDVTLIVDSSARYFMKRIDKVIVGADSIAANGAVVNKIGTSQIALAAHEARVVTFVAAESYKFHPSTLVGELVEIEERSREEVVEEGKFPDVNVMNPAFDVTPPDYVDLIITERGIIPPEAAYEILQERFELGLEEEGLF